MLGTTQRATLATLADVLIPADRPMPSATAAGVPTTYIDRALEYRPDLVEPFNQALARSAGLPPEAALDDLATAHSTEFAALSLLITGAYFLSPEVTSGLGHKPPPRAVRDDIDLYIDQLAAVVERGFDIH